LECLTGISLPGGTCARTKKRWLLVIRH
jgi:hypothetical protein